MKVRVAKGGATFIGPPGAPCVCKTNATRRVGGAVIRPLALRKLKMATSV